MISFNRDGRLTQDRVALLRQMAVARERANTLALVLPLDLNWDGYVDRSEIDARGDEKFLRNLATIRSASD